jgi:hypothetical protein
MKCKVNGCTELATNYIEGVEKRNHDNGSYDVWNFEYNVCKHHTYSSLMQEELEGNKPNLHIGETTRSNPNPHWDK